MMMFTYFPTGWIASPKLIDVEGPTVSISSASPWRLTGFDCTPDCTVSKPFQLPVALLWKLILLEVVRPAPREVKLEGPLKGAAYPVIVPAASVPAPLLPIVIGKLS